MGWGVCCCECGEELEFGDYLSYDSYYLKCPNGCHAAYEDSCSCDEEDDEEDEEE